MHVVFLHLRALGLFWSLSDRAYSFETIFFLWIRIVPVCENRKDLRKNFELFTLNEEQSHFIRFCQISTLLIKNKSIIP